MRGNRRSPRLVALALAAGLVIAPRPSAARDGDSSGMIMNERVFTGNPRAVLVADPVAYVALDTGLAIFDVSDASAPLLLSHLYLTSPAFDVAATGSLVFVANGESGLTIIDVSNAMSPRVVGNLPTAGTRGVAVQGGIAYLAEASAAPATVFGLRTVDVADPSAPVSIGFAPLPNGGLDVVVSGSTAYVGAGSELSLPDHGLAIIDVSDAALPGLVAFFDTGLAVNGVRLDGSAAVLAAGFPFVGALVLVDVSAPAAPQLMSRIQLDDAAMGVALTPGVAHVATRALGLVDFDITNKLAPVQIDALPTGRETWAVDTLLDVAFVAERSSNGSAGFTAIATLPLPAGLVELASAPFAEATDLAVLPGAAFLLRRDGLSIFDSSQPGPMVLLSTWSPPGADLSVLAVQGSLAAVGEADTIRLVDVTDPVNPIERGSVVLTGGVVVALELDGPTLYVVDGLGLATFDVTDPSRPTALGSFRTPAWSAAVAVEDDRAYLACGTQLHVLDVSSPSLPALDGTVDVGVPVYGIDVNGTVAVVTGLGHLVDTIDVSSPADPRVIGTLSGGLGFDVALQGSLAYVGAGDDGVLVIDVSVPSAPIVAASFDTSGTAVAVAPAGISVLVAAVDGQHWRLQCDACAAGCTTIVDIQPIDPVTCEGVALLLDGSASSVSGCGGAPAFQWFEDGLAIPGADQATWLLPGTHGPGTFDVTLEASCPSNPACSASMTTSVQVIGETWPVVEVASLRVRKSGGVDTLSWQIQSGTGDTNIHRSLVVREMSDWTITSASIVAASPTTTYDNTLSAATGQVIFFKVFGRRSCAGTSVTP